MKKSKLLSFIFLPVSFLINALLVNISAQVHVAPAPCNMNGWAVQTSGSGQTITFETGPATPPMPVGSAEFNVGPNGGGAAQLRHAGYQGTELADITTLTYSTFVEQYGSGGQAVYIILNVDLDGNISTITDQDLLFFEPVYQDATFFPSNPQASLMLNAWQTWNADAGGWWSVNGSAGATPGTGVKSLDHITTAYPNAIIINSTTGQGGVRLVAGFGAGAWDNFIGNADAFIIGVNGTNTAYNFEPCLDADGDGVPDMYDCDPAKKKNNKWLVCHNGHTICISGNAVQAHLNHGDQLGPCANGNRGGVPEFTDISEEFKIMVAPNPVISTATIKYELPVDAKVSIVLFDPQGKAINTLVNADRKAGVYNYQLDASKLPAGIYYYRMTAIAGDEQFVQGQKLMIVK